MSTRDNFIRALAAAYEVLADGAGRDLTDDRVALYCSIMEAERVPWDAASAAVARLCSRVKWFPKPAEIIDEIRGAVADRAELACSDVWREAANCTQRIPVLPDVIAMATVHEMGGWIRFGRADVRERGFMSSVFIKTYAIFCRRDEEACRAYLRDNGAAHLIPAAAVLEFRAPGSTPARLSNQPKRIGL